MSVANFDVRLSKIPRAIGLAGCMQRETFDVGRSYGQLASEQFFDGGLALQRDLMDVDQFHSARPGRRRLGDQQLAQADPFVGQTG